MCHIKTCTYEVPGICHAIPYHIMPDHISSSRQQHAAPEVGVRSVEAWNTLLRVLILHQRDAVKKCNRCAWRRQNSMYSFFGVRCDISKCACTHVKPSCFAHPPYFILDKNSSVAKKRSYIRPVLTSSLLLCVRVHPPI